MKKILFLLSIPALCLSLLTGCSSVKGVKNFSNSQFNYKDITNIRLANIEVSHIRTPKDLSYVDLLQLIPAFKDKSLGLNMNVNINVTNPNAEEAKLEGVEYIIWVDEREVISGNMEKKISIGANQTEVLSIPVSVNLLNMATFSTLDALLEFAIGLATDNPDASRMKVSLKPYFNIGNKNVKMPFFVTVGGDKIMPKKENK
ncbi:MAG: LEA type 2 family protein [Paludibacteraceae bacterium]|nr:LEA type 2 family protein [Paludibacteraceae bacterium]MBP5480239.1 LEA type 2 family protein [Paludibacteraceae bacterium]